MTDSNTSTPATPAASAAAATPAAAPAPASGWSPQRRSRLGRAAFAAVILAGAALALYAWDLPPFSAGHVSTDNAYVRGQTTVVSPQLSGYVVEVLVQDFSPVKAGQPLVRIDDRMARQKVAQARAQLAMQQAQLANARQSLASAQAAVQVQHASGDSASAQLARAQADLRRVEALVREGSISQRERDQAVAAVEQAQAQRRQSEAQRSSAQQQVRSVEVSRGALEAAVEMAQAQLRLAEIELANTVVSAPADGVLGEVGVRLGQFVSAGTQLMALVPQQLWVIANFKEAQTARMRVGQPVELSIDALEGAHLRGTVQSLSPAAGSEFSVIKPDNASGNFVKVAQRIPVRIAIAPDQALAQQLRPGMSVQARVDVQAAVDAAPAAAPAAAAPAASNGAATLSGSHS